MQIESAKPHAEKFANIGPLISDDHPWLRYGAAVLTVLAIFAARAAMAGLVGTQSPLLPFVLGIFVSAYLGGRGPALLATALSPVLATVWFTQWPHDAPPEQWLAHVMLFLVIAVLATFMMHALQVSTRDLRNSARESAALATAAEEYAQRLREADRRKDEFLAMLAHELRNPLTPIRNVAHILAKGPPDPNTVKRASGLLERQASHLTRLVDDLLEVARITRGHVILKREPVSLDSVIDMALETVQPLLDARYQQVSVSRAAEPVLVEGDGVRLSQVVANLLTNASKFSAEQSRIFVSLVGSDTQAELSVRDTGAGIEAQMLPRVFDLFRQGNQSLDRSQGGLGIGLTIVKHLVEMHGGRVTAQSPGIGQGSEFKLLLPRTPARVGEQSTPATNIGQRRRPRRVLVVEDNRDAALSLRELLTLEGHQVEVVHDGAAALSKLDEYEADLVLLDVGLPRMDGYEVANAIRSRAAQGRPRPRLIALTGYGREEDRQSAIRAGFDVHLTKPVEPASLLRVISEGS